ncbi:inactive TPR repeat-containing thioredoxin TTL3-like [Prosopis cineraria]|uniref:inactive TPR repeat-containing thioredoxin TTL3-like n=1 Tax=Prosopis cineraria TaxID=364024 RepID=UPI0024108D02|nr:inactive TPR repeat-containing thioredoxin TTL3-like [Prosopis cineraria]
MSQSGKSVQELGYDSLTTRFRDSMSCEENKPDFKELDLGSFISPLKIRGAGNAGSGSGAAATSSSSSSSSGSVTGRSNAPKLPRRLDGKPNHHSGELTGYFDTSPNASESLRSASATSNSKPGHRRSVSAGAPLIYSGGSHSSPGSSSCSNSATSGTNLLPTGNICPSGKILKSGMVSRASNRTDVLGSGTANYGHGNIMRGGMKLGNSGHVVDDNGAGNSSGVVRRAMSDSDPEEMKKTGNELYRSGHFVEALSLYDGAISISPNNAAYRSNRAAALTALGRLAEAAKECEEAVKLEPTYARAHQRLASLCLRFGRLEHAKRHLYLPGQHVDQSELQKLRLLEKHINQCAEGRKIGDWKIALGESSAAIAVGADFSPELVACKAEAYLKLHQLEDAEFTLSNIPKLEGCPLSCSQTKFFGMIGEAYVHFVHAEVQMAVGRFENAVAAAEKARLLDYSNAEVERVLNTVKTVARSRSKGNDLFSSGKFSEACSAYGEGLKYDSCNYVLYCNRAVCWSKLGLWEKSVEDCNQALNILPNYTKALFRRAASNAKLERWAEVAKDYETLKQVLPGDNEVVESLRKAQLALIKSRGEDYAGKLEVEVGAVSSMDEFKAAVASAGVSVVHFKEASDELCEEISPFINMLCVRYPSVKFIKVDVEECLAIARAEGVRTVPTFKIYKNGKKVKEMVRPTHQFLEESVRSCSSL